LGAGNEYGSDNADRRESRVIESVHEQENEKSKHVEKRKSIIRKPSMVHFEPLTHKKNNKKESVTSMKSIDLQMSAPYKVQE
jgi:hypothetical protein